MQQKIYYRKDYQAPAYQILSTYLTFELKQHEAMVSNEMVIERQESTRKDVPLVLNGEEQELFTLKLDGIDVPADAYEWTDTELKLFNVPDRFTLTVVSRIHPESNTKLEGLFKTGSMFCTQCEPHGFRRITFYLDRPDVMANFSTKIIADKKLYPVLLSNGNRIETGDLEGHRHYAIWQDPFKKPSYLFALVAGNLAKISDHFITQSGRKILLEIYTDAHFIEQCTFAMRAVKDAMRWDEIRFGREYDLDTFMIVASEDFNMGAMENKGLNIFNTKYILSSPETSTDLDYQNVHAVIGHEYFHNWTGNRITCRDWFQLSLKEGLTVFRDQEFTRDHFDPTVKRIEDVKIIRSSQFSEDHSPMAHPVRPDSYIEMNNFYTTTVYNKGAEVIRMQHTLLGAPGFRQGMDLYFSRHDGQAVTCDDFVAAMEDASHYDLSQFKNWYSQAGTPKVSVNSHYDAHTKTYTLKLTQNCPPTPGQAEKQPFYIPVKLGLVTREGAVQHFEYQGKNYTETVIPLKQSEETWIFEAIDTPPIPSLLRDFSAPVKLEINLSKTELKTLWQHDSNLFKRWEAGQALLSQVFKELLTQSKVNINTYAPYVLEPIQKLLADQTLAPAFISEAIQIPQSKAIAETIEIIDPLALCHSSDTLLHYVGQNLQDQLLETYHALAKNNTELHEPKAAGRRALKNICLNYLAYGSDEGTKLAYQQFKNAHFMTDKLSALAILCNSDQDDLKAAALEAFYQQFQAQPLSMDKWFLVQASSKNQDTRVKVQELMQHPRFNLKNPNKVYNLLLTFSQNIAAFHDQEGLGYAFIAEVIQMLDPINPIVAARFVRSLMNYKRFCAPYQALMQAELIKLSKLNLSSDSREIIMKSLS